MGLSVSGSTLTTGIFLAYHTPPPAYSSATMFQTLLNNSKHLQLLMVNVHDVHAYLHLDMFWWYSTFLFTIWFCFWTWFWRWLSFWPLPGSMVVLLLVYHLIWSCCLIHLLDHHLVIALKVLVLLLVNLYFNFCHFNLCHLQTVIQQVLLINIYCLSNKI